MCWKARFAVSLFGLVLAVSGHAQTVTGLGKWFDRQMKALEHFDVTLTFCFTPEHRGVRPHHTSRPEHLEEFASFAAQMVRRYA